ncbi:MAG: hypothetical protein LBB54_01025 [Cellulomonadaceae bacterium]|nr:hypothetical protein [Cellulomonadaceae bacterium]
MTRCQLCGQPHSQLRCKLCGQLFRSKQRRHDVPPNA